MPVAIPLSRGLVALVDEADAEAVLRHKWYAHFTGHTRIKKYAILAGEQPPPRLLHRWLLRPPTGVLVDHRDGDGLNCQRLNMRLATHQQNGQANRGAEKNPFPKGVRQVGRRFVAQIGLGVPRGTVYLGTFSTPEAAARAYHAAAAEHFGDFAILNFPMTERAALFWGLSSGSEAQAA